MEHDEYLNERFIKISDMIEWMQNNSNPCMNCGSVQCAICSDMLLKELQPEEKDTIKE